MGSPTLSKKNSYATMPSLMTTLKTPPTKKETMADFRPFRAWRYNSSKVDFQKMIAPPYDVISEAEQAQLYARSPHNCIRLILNKIEATDTEQNSRYTRARKCYSDWQNEEVLIREEKPSFYYYRQTFADPDTGVQKERSSILGRLHLEPFEKGVVVPHEKTLSKPRADRRKLLEATQTNFSPIFGLYEDEQKEVFNLLNPLTAQKPLYEATDDQKVLHRVWLINDEKLIDKVHAFFSSKKVYIADGHHRYQTSLEYAREKRAQEGGVALEQPFDFTLMALVEFHDAGLVLMPTHRMILPFSGFDPVQAIEKLKPFFSVENLSAAALIERIKKAPARKVSELPLSFGLMFNDKEGYWLTLKDAVGAIKKMPAGKADLWYKLDVSLVSHLILGGLWGVSETDWENTIRYTHSLSEATNAINGKEYCAVFLLQAPPVEILREMGNVKELMPQKSTYFYPKLASGLVFHSHTK